MLCGRMQEEERERRMDYVPEESAVNTETIEVNRATICCSLSKQHKQEVMPTLSHYSAQCDFSKAGD